MAHKPFHICKRPTKKKNHFIYYEKFFDEADNRMTAKSTGQTSKAAAENWAYEQLKWGIIPTEKNVPFGKFVENFWIWDKFGYVKSRKRRGANISQSYVDDMRILLVLHILPHFKDKKLLKIKSRTIESWLDELSEKKGIRGQIFSPTTVNRCLICLKNMLKELIRAAYYFPEKIKELK